MAMRHRSVEAAEMATATCRTGETTSHGTSSIVFWWLLPLLLLLAMLMPFVVGTSQALASNNENRGQPCTKTHRGPSFNSDVTVGSDETLCSDLTVFGGKLTIHGTVEGNIVVFNSNLSISGHVTGDVTLYGSSVTLQPGAYIVGNIYSCGATPKIVQPVYFHGSVIGCPQSIGQLLLSDVGPSVRFWSWVTWIALGLLLNYLLPEHLAFVRLTALHKMRRSIILGLLTVLLSLPVLAILIALIVTIPLAIMVVVGLIVAWAMGGVAVGALLGNSLLRRLAPSYDTHMWQIVVGITVLMVVEWLPYLGLLVQVGVGLLGLGAIFLSRFGTRLYSQPKQPMLL